MATEIERKFLVDTDKLPQLLNGRKITQGYLLAHSPSIRVRVYEDEAFLTIKGKPTDTISRSEFEYPIPLDDAKELLSECQNSLITKTRYEIDFDGHIWELDIFEGENEGLIVAEIELESVDEAFGKPDWVTIEVSNDKRYANASLSTLPFCEW